MVSVGENGNPFTQSMASGIFYSYWKALIEPRTDELKEMCKFKPDWTIGPEADEWIKTIGSDPIQAARIFVIRHTRSCRGSKEVTFQETSQEDLFPPDRPEDKKIVALVMKTQTAEFVKGIYARKGF